MFTKAQMAQIAALKEMGVDATEAARLVAGESARASSPVAVAKPKASKADNGFLAYVAAKKAAKVAERGYVACEQPRCTGVMHPDRSTTIRGRRACSKHYGRHAR